MTRALAVAAAEDAQITSDVLGFWTEFDGIEVRVGAKYRRVEVRIDAVHALNEDLDRARAFSDDAGEPLIPVGHLGPEMLLLVGDSGVVYGEFDSLTVIASSLNVLFETLEAGPLHRL